MTRRFRSERKKEHYYKKAKAEHYRSRASYKLKQLDYRYDLMGPGNTVVDLGASPGGWSQVALERVGPSGKVVAVDLDRFTPIEGVSFIRGDIRNESVVRRVLELLPERADVVISDMSPNISGNYSYDHARSIELCEHALKFARMVLRDGGHFVAKMFHGDMSRGFVRSLDGAFDEVHVHHPKASRPTSSEVYVVGIGFIRRD